MKNLIIERIAELQKEKQQSKVHPSNPNELELRREMSRLLINELDSLIEEGRVKVEGHTINRLRILSDQL